MTSRPPGRRAAERCFTTVASVPGASNGKILPAATTRSKPPAIPSRAGFELGQIDLEPRQSRRLLPRHRQHRRVKIHPDAVVPEFREPDHDPPGTAPGVQHPRSGRQQSGAEPRLTVHVLAATGQGRKSCGVVLSGRFPGEIRPTTHEAKHRVPLAAWDPNTGAVRSGPARNLFRFPPFGTFH